MSRLKLSRAAGGVAIALLAGTNAVQAANQYWDLNGTAPGAAVTGNTASGTWDTGATWNDAADGTGTLNFFNNDGTSTPVFSAGTDATGLSTITLIGGINSNGLTVEEGSINVVTANFTGISTNNGAINIATGSSFTIGDTPVGTSEAILAAGNLVKNGGGTFTVASNGSSIGSLVVNAGTVQLGQGNIALALAVGSASLVPSTASVASGATLNFRDNGGGGTAFNTATGILSGASVFYSGNVTGAGNVGFVNTSSNMVGYQIQTQSTYTGATNIIRSTVSLNAGGKLSGTSSISVGGDSVLALDNTGTVDNDRINDTAKINLNGGVFISTGNAGANTTETVGELHLGAGGQNYVSLEAGARTTGLFGNTLTVSSLTRDPGGALLLRGNVVGTNNATGINGTNLKITNTTGLLVGAGAVGTTSRGIIPGVYVDSAAAGAAVAGGTLNAALIGSNATLATYDTNGVRPLTTGEYSSTISGGVNLAPAALASLAVTASASINAIEFGGASNIAATSGGTITINSGQTLSIASGTILSNGTTVSTITGPATGTATLSAGTAGAAPLFIHSTTAMTLGSTVAGSLSLQMASLTKDGQGTVTIGSGVTVTNTGSTYINQGAILVNANGQLGSSVNVGASGLSLNTSTAGQSAGSLQLAGSVSYNIPLTLSGQYDAGTAATNLGQLYSSAGNNTWAGNISLTGNGLNSGDRNQQFIGSATGSNLTLSGIISSNAVASAQGTGLVFGNAGTTVLTGASANTFSGLARQYGGTLILEKDGALGIANQLAVDDNFIQNGSASNNVLAFRGAAGGDLNYTTQEWIFTNQGNDAFGTTQPGVVASIGGNNTFAGYVSLGNTGSGSSTVGPLGFNRIGVTAGSLKLTGAIWQQGTTGNRILEKYGTGELILTADSSGTSAPTNSFANQFTSGGGVLVTQGTLRLTGAGTLPSQMSNVVIARGGQLAWDDSTTQVSTRTQNAELDINGGEFRYVGSGSTLAPSNTKFGGDAIVSATGTGGTVLDLTGADRFSNSMHGTVVLRGVTNTTAAKVKLQNSTVGGGASSGTTQSIIPWAIGDTSLTGSGTDFVTVDASGYAHPLTSAEYASGITSGTNTQNNVSVSTATSLAADTQVNSVKLSAGGTGITVASGKTLTVNSGAIFNASGAASSITGGSLSFNNEAILNAPTGGDMTISSAITNANGLTKSGAGNVTLSGANSFGGQVTVNNGTLIATNDAALGSSGNQVFLAGGNLSFGGTSTFSTSRNFNLTSFTNNFWLTNAGTIDFGSNTVTATGAFNGSGTFNINAGTNGNVTFTGNSINNSNGPLTLNVASGATMTVNEGINLNAPAYLTINVLTTGAKGVFNGDLNGQASTVIGVGVGSSATFAGNLNSGNVVAANIAGTAIVTGHWNHPGTLSKGLTGTLTLTGENDYTGATTVNSGTLIFPATTAIGSITTTSLTTAAAGTAEYQPTVDGDALQKPVVNAGTIQFDIGTGLTAYYANSATSPAAQIISGAGKLLKTGAGTLKIGNQSTQNSYTGGTLIQGGVLEYDANDAGLTTAGLPSNTALAAGYWQISNNATLRFNEGAAGAASFGNANRTIQVGTGGGTVEVTALTASQPNAGLLGATTLTKTGPGAFLLTTSNTSFTGKISVAQGLLEINNDNNFGPVGTAVVADELKLADATTLRVAATTSLGVNRGITLTSGSPTITTLANSSLTVAGPISGAPTTLTLSPNGTGVITFNGANTYTGETSLTAGKLVLGSSFTTSSKLTIADGASAQLTAGGKVLKYSTLNFNSTGKLDLTDGKLILTGTTADSLRGLLATGYAGGAWTGAGLNSSTAAANASGITTIAYATAGDLGVSTWGGVAVSSTDLVTKLGYYGDLNLDGKINGDDYALADRSLAKGGLAGNAHFTDGDVNYDGVVNSADFLLIDKSFGLWNNVPLSPALLAQREAQFGEAYVTQLIAAVPEPTSLGVIGLAGMAMIGRRRRQHS